MRSEIMTSHFNVKFVRSFGRDDQTMLGCWAFFACLLISLGFIAVLRTYLTPFLTTNMLLPMHVRLNVMPRENVINTGKQDFQTPAAESLQLENKVVCSTSDRLSDTCEIKGDIRIYGNQSRISVVSSRGNISWHIKPYARKVSVEALQHVNEFTLEYVAGNAEELHACTKTLVPTNVPAILFSTGGFTGNIFHDFSDVLIPLFLTSYRFHGEVQFLVSDHKWWWLNRYRVILKAVSNFEIINIDRSNQVYCGTTAFVGLRAHRELGIDPARSPQGYSMHDFAKFMRSSYELERENAGGLDRDSHRRPRLLVVSRKRTRRFTNLNTIEKVATKLGYDVVIAEANQSTNLSNFSRIVNSCDVMMGVHGAGLSNLVFLPTNAVFIQIIPLGGLEKHSRMCYKEAAADMKLKYMEYKIKESESSLIKEYPPDHEVFRSPISIHKKGWEALRSIYLDKQNVRLNMKKFRSVLWDARGHLKSQSIP